MSAAPGDRASAARDPGVPSGERPAAGRRSWAGRVLPVAGLVALIALLTYGLLSKAPNDTIDQSLARGEPATAPGFELAVLQEGRLPAALGHQVEVALADGEVSLIELRGIPLVLNFWASWCDPCRDEAPLLSRSWSHYGPKGTLFVGVNMQDATEDARRFMREFGNDYLNVRDPTDDTARQWGATGIPETFFVTASGQVVSHVIGVVSDEQMRVGVAATRSGRAVSPLSGGARRPTR